MRKRVKLHYRIGSHLMAVEGEKLCDRLISMVAFETFRTEDAGEEDMLFVETEHAVPDFEQTLYELTDLDTTFTFGRVAHGYRMNLVMDNGLKQDLWTYNDDNRLWVSGDWDVRMLRSILWTGYGLKTVEKGAIPIHSSCVVHQNQAVLCLGESGTGKSTHTRLWREFITGSHLLNDDSPILKVEDGKVWVYGSPWSGKTPCYRAERFPLKACIRLSQAPCNSIRKLNVAQAYAALHPSCPPAFAYDNRLYDAVSHTLGEVLAHVPCYHLACLPNEDAARLSHFTLFESRNNMLMLFSLRGWRRRLLKDVRCELG